MNKNELLSILNDGISSDRISKSEYDQAITLYSLIYETHTATESSTEHASLSVLINKAGNADEEDLKKKMAEEYEAAMTSADLQLSKSKNNFRDFGGGYFHDQYHTQQDLNNVDV